MNFTLSVSKMLLYSFFKYNIKSFGEYEYPVLRGNSLKSGTTALDLPMKLQTSDKVSKCCLS